MQDKNILERIAQENTWLCRQEAAAAVVVAWSVGSAANEVSGLGQPGDWAMLMAGPVGGGQWAVLTAGLESSFSTRGVPGGLIWPAAGC